MREYNESGNLLYAADYPGAFTRGRTLSEALEKLPGEVELYCRWSGLAPPEGTECGVVQTAEESVAVAICDGDTEVLFDSEAQPLSRDEYQLLRRLVLKSAESFQYIFDAVPDKDRAASSPRSTFYGSVPRTAREMYRHTNGVTGYYIRQLGVPEVEDASIITARTLALQKLCALPKLFDGKLVTGDFGEQWSVRKVLRRFLWHDRIHGKAMVRMAHTLWGDLENPFFFS